MGWIGLQKEGVKAAEWLIKEKGKEKGDVNIAVLQGTIGSSAEIGRTKGFKEGIKDQKTSRSLLLRQENLHRQKVRKLWNLS